MNVRHYYEGNEELMEFVGERDDYKDSDTIEYSLVPKLINKSFLIMNKIITLFGLFLINFKNDI